MYFIKRAFLYVKNKKGRTILLGIIFLVIANFVLAGLLVQNASEKAQDNTRMSIGADINYEMDWITYLEDVQRGVIDNDNVNMRTIFQSEIQSNSSFTEGGAPTYENFMKVADSDYMESYDIDLSFTVTAENLTGYSLDNTQQQGSSGFSVKLSAAEEPLDFKDGDEELISGRFAEKDEIANGANVVLVEESLADLNDLNIGDTITVYASMLDYENVEVEYEIIGIYSTNEDIQIRGTLPQNRFYVPFNSIKSIGLTQDEINNIVISSNIIRLKDPLDIDSFKKEAEEKIDIKYAALDANDDLYESLTGPIESLGKISGILVIIISAAGALIIGLITALTVNERKEEIGILLAVGEKKMKIVSQFVIEVVAIALIAFILSTFTGSYIGKNISNVILESDILQSQENDQQINVMNFMGSMRDNRGSNMRDNTSSNINNNAGNNSDNNISNNARNNIFNFQQELQDDVEAADVNTNINLSISVMLQLLVFGLVLSALSTIIPSLYVMRFNPKQILTNKL